MRYLLSILALTASGCGSTSWLGSQSSTTAMCDGATCAECPLGMADPVDFDAAPVIQYPTIEGAVDRLPVPASPAESVPAPTPDPST